MIDPQKLNTDFQEVWGKLSDPAKRQVNEGPGNALTQGMDFETAVAYLQAKASPAAKCLLASLKAWRTARADVAGTVQVTNMVAAAPILQQPPASASGTPATTGSASAPSESRAAARGRAAPGKWQTPAAESLDGIVSGEGGALGRGDQGPLVKEAQELLVAKGYKMQRYGADGKFGGVTESVLKEFQAANALEQTGKFDAATLKALRNPGSKAREAGAPEEAPSGERAQPVMEKAKGALRSYEDYLTRDEKEEIADLRLQRLEWKADGHDTGSADARIREIENRGQDRMFKRTKEEGDQVRQEEAARTPAIIAQRADGLTYIDNKDGTMTIQAPGGGTRRVPRPEKIHIER